MRFRAHTGKSRVGLVIVMIAFGCGPRPLRTPPVLPIQQCPPASGRVAGLFGFDDHAVLLPLTGSLDRLLVADGFRVERRRRGDDRGLDVAIVLEDFRPDIVSGATPRRRTNIYFLGTVLAMWMIPIMGAFDHSVVALETRVTMRDARGHVLWQGTKDARNDEGPSGMPGEDDEHYTRTRLDRVGNDLAARLHDELCSALTAP